MFSTLIQKVLAWLGLRGAPTLTDEEWTSTSGDVTREMIDHMADAHGFEYARYRLADPYGNTRVGYRRVIPTTYLFTCPDCGGLVVGEDTPRVRPGDVGPDPTAFVCEGCGRRETHEFGLPRIEYQESDLTLEEPRGLQPLCPKGGAHQRRLVHTWTNIEFPPGVDACTENLHLAEEVEHRLWVCDKCGQTRENTRVI